MDNNKKKFEGLGTKIDPAMYEVLNACCDALGVDVYHLLQWFAYTIIKASSPMHNLDPRIQKLLTLLESDAGWQQAFNIANPDRLKIAQVILILEQENHKGFGAVMIDRYALPGETPHQTECVDTILERVLEVTMRGIYRRLRLMGAKMECNNFSDVLLSMIDAQTTIELEENFRREMPGMGDQSDGGRQVAFGKKSKAKQYRTPDSVAHDQRFHFDDDDRELADMEAGYHPDDWEGEHKDKADFGYDGFKPFDVEP